MTAKYQEGQLIIASGTFDLEAARRAIANGANIHEDNDLALLRAVAINHKNDLDMIRFLIESGADVCAQKNRALVCAVEYMRPDKVLVLLDAGADLASVEATALDTAAFFNNIDVLSILLQRATGMPDSGCRAVQTAIRHGDLKVVEMLLAAGTDPRLGDDFPARLACRYGRIKIARTFFNLGASMKVVLDIAVHEKIKMKILVEHAATVRDGYETVFMLEKPFMEKVLHRLHPEMKPKQIRGKLAMLEALGLDAAQMGEVWQAQQGVASTKQEMARVTVTSAFP